MPRLNPRRLVPVQARRYQPTTSGDPAWEDEITVRGVYEASKQGPSDLTNVGRLITPPPGLPLHSLVTIAGLTCTVTGVADALARRRVVLTEMDLADPLPHHLGWDVTVAVTDGGGMDDNNDPLPSTTRVIPLAVIVPAGSLEPDDRAVDAQTTAKLYLPPGETLGSTSSVTIGAGPFPGAFYPGEAYPSAVEPGSPMGGVWEVVGDPDVTPTRTVVELHR